MFTTKSDDITYEDHQRPRLRIAADDVILLQRSCSLLPVYCSSVQIRTGIAEHIKALEIVASPLPEQL
ncbi:hypothetical protein HPB50_010422 [Hyalomma asiaticum]|uniref:Uncharacterized protein n=1 Tax=Hyalomma asiaticum TaxID=266040 RepID=A0ACB7SFK7_HYAAI|nr:hypothetical protein HPB50_010422 [Hyalomma asiaticum]